MGKVFKGVVVDNDLFVEYHNFKSGKPFDRNKVQRLLHFYKNKIVSNIRQYEETGVELASNLKIQMAHDGLKKQSLEVTATNNTLYKIILSTTQNEFPYVNIMDDNLWLENNFSASFDNGEDRTLAVEHIKALCSHANKIALYDKYFNNKPDNIDLLKRILPNPKKIDIVYYNMELSDDDIVELNKLCATWNFIKGTLAEGRHDRYLIIDDSLEVILSSGFDHLNSKTGDFTYVLRPVQKSRFM